MASVANSRASAASPALAAWMRARRAPTSRAKPGTARPARSSLFHSGWRSPSRNSMANSPASSCASTRGALPGAMRAAACIQRHS
jgi:hypothetical protein